MVTSLSLEAQQLDVQCAALKHLLRVPYSVQFPTDLLSNPPTIIRTLASELYSLEVKPSVIVLAGFNVSVLYQLVAAISKLPLGFPDQVRMGPQIVSYVEAFKPILTDLDGPQHSQLGGPLLGIAQAKASRGLAVLLQRRFRKLTVLQADRATPVERLGLLAVTHKAGCATQQVAYFDGRGL